MADERDEIRARINIVQLVGQRVSLKKAGKDWKGLCPFHDDKTPSFTVSERNGNYRCWSCGEHGDMFTWVMKTQNVEFPEALEILAEQAGVELTRRGPVVSKSERAQQRTAMDDALQFFQEQLSKSGPGKEYLERRGIDAESVKSWELGYAPDIGEALVQHLKRKGHPMDECKALFLIDQRTDGSYYDKFRGRLIFPIRDERGDLVAFGGRLLGDGNPKYINSSDTPLYRKSRVLYGMYRAKDALNATRRAVLTEGYLDVIACQRAGVTGALASLGTALSEDHAKLLRRWVDEVVILYDSDAAGQKAAERAIDILGAEGLAVRIALMPEGDDPDTLLKKEGPGAVLRSVEQGQPPLDFKIARLLEKGNPNDKEKFWPAAIEILATAPSDMELQRHLVHLAAMYPGIPEPLLAQASLRREVLARRRRDRGAPAARPRVSPPVIRAVSELLPAETMILGAFVGETFRSFAWSVMQESGMFTSHAGSGLAAVLLSSFPDGPPEGEPKLWLHLIEEESDRDLLIRIGDDPRLDRLDQKFLDDTVAKMRKAQETRKLGELKNTGQSSEILKRLKQLKPSYEKEKIDEM